MEINGRKIGNGEPCYIIAELSANHNQSFEKAVEMVHAAKEAGADAIKLQTYTADTITLNCQNEYFKIGKGTIWEGRTLYGLYEEAQTPWEWQPKLKKLADRLGMDLFSSPFDCTSVDFLEKMDVPCYKIASFEIVDIPLIKKAASTGKPIIFSTGMASMEEIEEALKTIRKEGNNQIAILKCTSAYPALPEEMNLATITDMKGRFGALVGLSDHSMSLEVPLTAVALGACIIEKHFILDRSDGGPDSGFSLEPKEFKYMVDSVRIAEKSLGKVSYDLSENQQASRQFRKSLFVAGDMIKGEVFTEKNLRSVRPGNGLHTRYFEDILGKKASMDIKMGTPLSWEKVDN